MTTADRAPCGHDPHSNFFDRTLCPPPCDKMHTCCRECGAILDGCAHQSAAAPTGGCVYCGGPLQNLPEGFHCPRCADGPGSPPTIMS